MNLENVPTDYLIMTPDHPFFDLILNTSRPPGWKETQDFSGFFTVGTDGIMRPASEKDFDEYLEGGEYDEVLAGQDQEEDCEINY